MYGCAEAVTKRLTEIPTCVTTKLIKATMTHHRKYRVSFFISFFSSLNVFVFVVVVGLFVCLSCFPVSELFRLRSV